ncbi:MULTISPECIES: caspase family protein [unclassified Sphingopyxis]|uniref:caspase family protein n=1 Tax=unclassified Sphingopyxis TaxID=2614943 RepID=UPI00142F2EBA|nr:MULTISPECIES: caspase family protein [unclassified Sphingopyxis]
MIGNSKYKPAQPSETGAAPLNDLPNACRDSQNVADGLVTIGWAETEIVQKCDLTTLEMVAEVRQFVEKILRNPYSIAVFYYAGHGVQIDSRTFLFGVNARPDFETVRTQIATGSEAQLLIGDALDVSADFTSAVGNITEGGLTIILDACRSDPVIQELKGDGFRRITVPRPEDNLLPGIVVAVSAQGRASTPDNGLYARTLRDALKPRDDVLAIFHSVNSEILRKTRTNIPPQIPAVMGSLYIPCFADCVPDDRKEQPVSTSAVSTARVQYAQLDPPMRRAEIQSDGSSTLPVRQGSGAAKSPNDIYSVYGSRGLPQQRGKTVDIFYCDDGADADGRKAQATDYANMIAERAKISPGQIVAVRLRALSTKTNSRAEYRFLNNAVVADPWKGSGEDEIAELLMEGNTVGLQRYFSSTTPFYVSVFLCAVPPRASEATVYWHAPTKSGRDLARRLKGQMSEEKGRFRSVPDVEIVEASPENTEVRFYSADDRDVAFKLADSLQHALGYGVTAKLMTPTGATSSAGTLEVWLGKRKPKHSDRLRVGSVFLPSRNNLFDPAARPK